MRPRGTYPVSEVTDPRRRSRNKSVNFAFHNLVWFDELEGGRAPVLFSRGEDPRFAGCLAQGDRGGTLPSSPLRSDVCNHGPGRHGRVLTANTDCTVDAMQMVRHLRLDTLPDRSCIRKRAPPSTSLAYPDKYSPPHAVYSFSPKAG